MSKTSVQIVEKVSKKKKLETSKNHLYCLTHTYDNEPRKYWVSAPYTLDTFDVIVAFIQYECSEIEESFGMDQEDVIKVLERFYGCKELETPDRISYYEVDLYENWEMFCGTADQIQSIELLKREGLNEVLAEFVEVFYQSKPEWRPKNECSTV
ncbi:hypothetical protein [Paenibacillus sp. FSL E2-0178]|uniref:hypothetical protein n=1 Tax=Paenibacillus sp. FSL E2-0178 TaxID=2921361 RepID=UPI0031590B42